MFLDDFIRFLRIKKVKKYIPKNIVLCDLGCGTEAYFLYLISPRLKKGIGIDKKIFLKPDLNLVLISSF